MNNGGLYKNVKITLSAANLMVFVTIALLVFCFVFAVVNAEKSINTDAEYSTCQEKVP